MLLPIKRDLIRFAVNPHCKIIAAHPAESPPQIRVTQGCNPRKKAAAEIGEWNI